MKKHIIRFFLWCLAKIGYSVVPLEIERAAQAEIAQLNKTHASEWERILGAHESTVSDYQLQIESLRTAWANEKREILKDCKFKITKASRLLPESMQSLRNEVISLCAEEAELNHGSTDILGDSWLKFRRVASKLKKAHPDLPKSDIFKTIIIICEEAEDVPA